MEGAMPQDVIGPWLPEPRRMEVFHLLVLAQDLQMTVADSRAMVAARHGLTPDQIRCIEREGLERSWPPLA
jgi:hypothetical protein